ncbi:MAG TPA: diguanylate cyclase, partial [Burkholderiales bacterium]|nr:diguanylate cyclase [Burkholderiales bacterium]
MRPKVLLFDDREQHQQTLRDALGDEFEVHAAIQGEQGLALARMLKPDVILLDLGMRDLDPYAIHARLRADTQLAGVSVIYVTQRADTEVAAQCIALGADDALCRPYHSILVKARLRLHIELKRAREALQTLRSTDELTRLANRRSFEEQLATEWRRCGRASTYLSMLLIEVDRFDAVDSDSRDSCLQSIALCLGSVIYREPDLLSRYEESRFALLLPETSPVGAIHVAERLQKAMTGFDATGTPLFTLSVGIATLMPQANTSPHALALHAQ